MGSKKWKTSRDCERCLIHGKRVKCHGEVWPGASYLLKCPVCEWTERSIEEKRNKKRGIR